MKLAQRSVKLAARAAAGVEEHGPAWLERCMRVLQRAVE